VANLIIFIWKNGEKEFSKILYFFFHFLETFSQFVGKIQKQTNWFNFQYATDLISYMLIVVKVIFQYILAPLQ
jgi:hypothetical protein